MGVPAGEVVGEGWDHVARLVEQPEGAWIVREAKEGSLEERRARVAWEVAVMRLVRSELGPVVPDGRVVAGRPEAMTYPLVAGVPLQELVRRGVVTSVERRRLARWLGRLVAAVGRSDPDSLGLPVVRDDGGFAAWYAEIDRSITAVGPVLDGVSIEALERFRRTPPPPDAGPADVVLAHNDLGAEHVLIDHVTGRVTGILDWSDAAVTDLAADVGRLVRDLGADVLGDVLDGAGITDHRRAAVEARAWCYARLLAVEDLAYARERRPELVAHERVTVARLFAAL